MNGGAREAEALWLVAGFGLWSVGFALLYGAHGLACSLGVAPVPARAALGLILAATLAAHLWLVALLRRRVASAAGGALRFVRLASLALAAAAAGATLWTGFPVLTLGACS